MYKVSIIIPCFNEEDNIRRCVQSIPILPWSYEIIVIDDGSTDNTYQVAKRAGIKNLRVFGYPNNRGKGFAVRLGIEKSSGEIGIILDADMATPPEYIEKVLTPIIENRADFANGSRLIYPMERGAMKGAHVLGNKIFAFFISILIRKKLSDTLCGFKAFRIEYIKGQLKQNTWPDFELLLAAKKNNMRIEEIPIQYKKRTAGKSKMKTFRHAIKMSRILLSDIIHRF